MINGPELVNGLPVWLAPDSLPSPGRNGLARWPSPDEFAALEAMAEETGRSLNELLDEAVRLLLKQRAGSPPASGEGTGRGDV